MNESIHNTNNEDFSGEDTSQSQTIAKVEVTFLSGIVLSFCKKRL